MSKRILALLLLGAMLVTGVPVFAEEAQSTQSQTENEANAAESTVVDLDEFYVKEGLVAHFSTFGKNASTVNLSTGKWTDLVAGKTATFDVKERWSVNTNGSVGFTSFCGTLDESGAYVKTSAGNNYSTAVRLNFGLALLPTEDYTVEYMAMYKPLYLYDASAADHIARDSFGNKLETFDFNRDTTGIFVHKLAVDTLGWFQNLASAIDGVIFKDWRYGLTEDDINSTRSISHWTFGMNNGDAENGWYLDSSGRQGWWLGISKRGNGGLNVLGNTFQKNNVIATYGISVDETVTDSGDTEAVFSLYRDAVFYNSNKAQNDLNTTAKGLADGGYVADFDEALCRFWLSCYRPTDFFGVRIYDRVLTDAERRQNKAVDVLNYYGVGIPEEYIEDELVLSRMLDVVADEELVTDALGYIAKAKEVENKVKSCYPKFDTLDELYVKDGLVALYAAFVGDNAYLTKKDSDIIWQNRVFGAADATFEKAGWAYNADRGGVGYDLIYGQLNTDGTFTTSYANATYSNANRLRFDLQLLPKDDFTLEYVARYDLTYVYDAASGELIPADDAGTSSALPPNEIVGQPVDVIGFISSYTGKRGCYWADAGGVGSLRWRSVDKGGYKGWDNNYGMHGLDLPGHGMREVGSYVITRDESTSGEGDTLVTSAVYTYYLNGAISKDKNKKDAIINATTENEVGPGKYYHQDDDTEFYLSYKLGTTFYSLRLYNRVLSAQEQKQNRAVDLMRYYDITLPEEVWGDETVLAAVYEAVATQSFVYDALGYAAAKVTVQSVVSAAMHRVALADKFAQSEHLTLLFTSFCPETVDLAAGKWTDLVSGKKATLLYGGTNYWKMNADGSVGYTTFYGVVGADGVVVANSATDNYKTASNRLQFGLSLLPESDFSVEYFAKYKPIYVYDANEADKIARADDGSLMETDHYMTRAIAYANLHVEYPIDQLGWFTGITSVLDSTSHYWRKENQLQRGSVHWHFNCPSWYYETSSHQGSYLGSTGISSHVPGAGLNNVTDAFQKNNALCTYGIYLDETLTVADDGTRTTTAVFSLYRNASLYNSNASNPNSTANAFGGTFYYDIDTALTSSHNFWLSSTRATDFFTVRIYDIALSDEEKQYNYVIDMLLYYGVALTDEMWENDNYMSLLAQRLVTETAEVDALARAAKCAELQKLADDLYADVCKVKSMSALYANAEHLTAFFTVEAATSVSLAFGIWYDYLGGNTATLGNAAKGYWKIREDGAVGYDVIYGELSNDGTGTYIPTSVYTNYSDYGTRLDFGIALLPKGDFTVEYVAEYRPVYAADENGNPAISVYDYGQGSALPESQQYGQTKYVPVDFLGYLSSYTTRRDGCFSGRTYRGEVRWVVHEPVLPTSHWDYSYFTQTMSANADIFQTRNEIRAYGISRAKTTAADGLVTAKYTLMRDTVQYASSSFSRKTYEDRIAATANNQAPYKPPVVTDFAKDDTGYFYLSERMSTDFYNVRIYDIALTAEDYQRNRFVDLMYFYDIEFPTYLAKESVLADLAARTKDIAFGADSLAYEAERAELLAIIRAFEKVSSENSLYVQDGLKALYTAFAGESDLLNISASQIGWKNRVLGEKDATFEKAGWSYNATMGGVSYDVIYGTVDTVAATFSASGTQNNYDRGNRLNIGLDLLPKEDFTLEYVANYRPVLSYDTATGGLVDVYATSISGVSMPTGTTEPVDTVGFLSSYTTQHGGRFYVQSGVNVLGLLRWRSMDKAGYKTWSDNGYGWGGNLVTQNRASRTVETYAITRDEATADGVVTACYTHLLNGATVSSANYTSVNTKGDNRYYTFEDDTEFYLSYKLGTTFYALRVYDRVLTAEEQKQNRMADILGYYGVAIPDSFVGDALRYDYVLALCQTLDFEQDAVAYATMKNTLQTAVIGNDKQVTLVVDGEETTDIVYGDNFPLPKSVKGTNLFAWHMIDAEGNVLASYAPGESVKLTETETTFRALVFGSPETKYGVTLKPMAPNGFGMRFTATMDKAELLALIDEYGAGYIRMGMLITPKQYVDNAGAFTREALRSYVMTKNVDGARAFVEIQSTGFYSVDEDVCTLSGTLYKFSAVTIDKNPSFAAIAYIDIDTDKDGDVDKTVYGSFANNTCRSPKQAVETIDYMNIQLTDTQREWVDGFMKKYEDKTFGSAGDKTVGEQRQEILDAFNAAIDTKVEYTVHPFASGEVADKYSHIQAISFDGLTMGGKKTRIFAYVGLPEGASAENPVPAMVLVHGGGGHAYMEWVRLWNERGYAAIAMETMGDFPTSPGSGVTEGVCPTTREFPQYLCDVIDEEEYVLAPNKRIASEYKEVDEHWQYHGLSAVILSHNVLRDMDAVDESRIGTIGVSWGGTMVSQVIGYDTRFAFAIPIYGTAYISEPERPFIGSNYVSELWAAERNLNNFKNPIMWFAWADDNNFVMSSYNKSYLHSRQNNSKTTLVVLNDWRHSHQHGWNKEHGYAFADSICFPDKDASYANFISHPNGQNAASQVLLPEGATNVSVRFHYLTEPMVYKTYSKYFESSWLVENWKTDNKTLSIDPTTGKIAGIVPADVRSYYISVTYTINGVALETSSEFIMVR